MVEDVRSIKVNRINVGPQSQVLEPRRTIALSKKSNRICLYSIVRIIV